MATYASILAWEIPGTEEPGGLQSEGSQRVRHDWATKQYKEYSQEFRKSHTCTGKDTRSDNTREDPKFSSQVNCQTQGEPGEVLECPSSEPISKDWERYLVWFFWSFFFFLCWREIIFKFLFYFLAFKEISEGMETSRTTDDKIYSLCKNRSGKSLNNRLLQPSIVKK